MQVDIKETSPDELNQLLRLLVVAKFAPEERQLLVGHPVFETIVQEAVERYRTLEGDDKYKSEFSWAYLPDSEMKLIAFQYANLCERGKVDVELLGRLSAPLVLSPKLIDDVVATAEEFWN